MSVEPGERQGADHVDVAQPLAVAERHRPDVGPRLHRRVVHHQQRRRCTRRQRDEVRGDPLLQRALQVGIERGGDARLPGPLLPQPLREQGRVHRHLQRTRHDRFDARVLDLLCRPHLQRLHAREHLVARRACRAGVAIRTQPARRLRQHRQQGGFGVRQARGRLAEVGPAGRLHALDGAAERGTLEVQLQDLPLGQVRLQLQGARQLAQLAGGAARVIAVEDPRHLHGQGRAAGNDAAAAQPLPRPRAPAPAD